MSKEVMKLALEALQGLADYRHTERVERALSALREALAEQPAQQDSACSNALRAQGKAYPRTCKKCGLGPCVGLAQQALDKMAENARELGLDYDPSAGTQVKKVWWDGEKLMAKQVPLEDFHKPAQQGQVAWTLLLTGENQGLVGKAGEKFVGAPEYYERVDVYTSPQRTWVDLTDEQIDDIYQGAGKHDLKRARQVLAAFKEKNT